MVSGASAFAQSTAPAPAAPPPVNGEPHTLVEDPLRPLRHRERMVRRPDVRQHRLRRPAGLRARHPRRPVSEQAVRRRADGESGIGSADTYVSENDLGDFSTYGGLLLQYVLQSTAVVHPSFESTIASGRFCRYHGRRRRPARLHGQGLPGVRAGRQCRDQRHPPPPPRGRRRVPRRDRRERARTVEPRHEQPGRAHGARAGELLTMLSPLATAVLLAAAAPVIAQPGARGGARS